MGEKKTFEHPPLADPFISEAYSRDGEKAGVPVASDSGINLTVAQQHAADSNECRTDAFARLPY